MIPPSRRPPGRRPGAAALLAAALLLVAPAAAQQLDTFVEGPQAEWRVVATEHFRVHYPAPAEAWARLAAARLEAVRELVAAEVGYAHRQVVDVVVSDPVAQPNGFALPVLGWPRMVLWTSPPGPQSVIGHYRDWGEMLLVHEEAHLAHLLRPSRNPWRRLLATLLPLGPIANNAPRWVTEGYATVIEGRLTGSGRPHGDLRAAVLRRWAQAGRLPTYGRLAGDADSYLGLSMAYLAGSAFLEWLEAEAGEGALRDLWARMTAREARGFEEAFRGVFGAPPAELYGRFTAELTWQALEVERRLADGPESGPDTGWVDGELWLDLAQATGAPAVSPAGDRVALVLDHREEPSELAIWSTGVDEEALERRRERREEILAADPQDVLSVERLPPPRERLATLPAIDGAAPSEPRFLPDGESLLVVRYLPDELGTLRPDLFRWWPLEGDGGRGRLERVTRRAAVRSPDPHPDGTWAVAVRSLYGLSQLVRVDLATGAVEAITEPALATGYDGPRLAPDGERLAYARHRAAAGAPRAEPRPGAAEAGDCALAGAEGGARTGGGWELVVRDLATGAEESLPLPAGATASSPAWGRGDDAGTLYALVGCGGFVDVHAFRRDAGGAWTLAPVTRVRGAAFGPEPDGAGGLFFLDLDPDGLDLHRIEVAAAPAEPPRRAVAGLVPAVAPPAPPPPPPLATADLPPSRLYTPRRQELMLLSGGGSAAGGDRMELGLRGGDLLGRLDWVVTGAGGDRATGEGAAAALAWRDGADDALLGPGFGLPGLVDWRLHLFAAEEAPSRGPLAGGDAFAVLREGLDVERRGVELSAGWQRRASTAGGLLRFAVGAYAGRTEPQPAEPPGTAPGIPRRFADSYDEESLFAEGLWQPRAAVGEWWGGVDLAGRYDDGTTGELDWQRLRGRAAALLGRGDAGLRLSWEHGEVSGAELPWQLFQVGGAPESLLPSTVEAARVLVPALPPGTLVGKRFDAQRVELDEVLPLPVFWARYRVADPAGGDGDWIALAGVELRTELGPVPLLRLPELAITLGVARILDPPFEGDTEWWAALAWRP